MESLETSPNSAKFITSVKEKSRNVKGALKREMLNLTDSGVSDW